MRARDLAEAGIARETRRRLVQRGEPEQPERRLYRRVGGPMAAEASIAEVAHRTPHAVMALLSALRVHGLTTHCPQEVRVCIDRRARFCVRPPVRLRVLRVGGEGLRLGVETHVIEGMSVKVTTAARTIVDCFRRRDDVGRDMAIEACATRACRHWRGLPGPCQVIVLDAAVTAAVTARLHVARITGRRRHPVACPPTASAADAPVQ